MIFSELRQFWRITRKVLVIIGLLLSFFALMELLRAYLTLAELHPWAGYAYLVLLAAALLGIIYYIFSIFSDFPHALTPPPQKNARKYAKYLIAYLKRLELNDALTDDEKSSARTGRSQLADTLRSSFTREKLKDCFLSVEKQTVEPLIKRLDRQADKKIRAAVRDIMLAVTVSPYRSIDLLVVLYRNLQMIKNIETVYNSRPPLKETLRILYDTARVVATVNFVNLGTKMIENVTRGLPRMIPGVGRIIDDRTEGLAAGLLTSITGHAAKFRCRAYRKWDYEEAKNNLANHLKNFTADVGKMFFSDITPNIHLPGSLTLEKWKELRDSIAHGFNETVEAIQNFVRRKPPNKESA